jgi:competence protein ComEA
VALAPDPPTGVDVDDVVLRRPPPPRSWRDRAEDLADATGTTPGRILAGGAALVAAVLLGLWMTRPPAPPVETSLPFAPTSELPAASTTTTEATVVVVHVAGAVVRPGVHELPTGARVVDAIEAAGGLLPAADGARLNLAAPVTDGERVYVPTVGEEPPPPLTGGAGVGGTGAPAGPVDLNRADEAALDALPGVGPATAAAIIEHRDRIGGFTSVEQLLDVRGIGEAKLEQLRSLVMV